MKVNVLSIKEKPFRSEGMYEVEIELGVFFAILLLMYSLCVVLMQASSITN